jgi:glycosyltransferase involved in cell wall biosynthesis
MTETSMPLVTIVTPVYNGAAFLKECIESVLSQTYNNWEYLIVDNCSDDSTRNIAHSYASRDNRIHVHNYDEFVDVITSHNRALRLIRQKSKYCKIVSADDWLFPECITRMVEFAELHPLVGIVNAYGLCGEGTRWRVKFDGLPYQVTVVSGREACRWHLLGGRYYFGIPTSVLYRADLILGKESFFPNMREHADVSLFYDCLLNTDLGFVHQVLSYERIHLNALSWKAKKLNTYFGSHLLDIARYGPTYLSNEELAKRINDVVHEYYALLASGVLHHEGENFWRYHEMILMAFGAPLNKGRLAMAVCTKIANLVLNPKTAIEKLLKNRHQLSFLEDRLYE